MPPEARIAHQTPDRVRLRLNSLKGDREALAQLVRELAGYRKTVSLKTGVATGSVVLSGRAINIRTLEQYALSRGLFHLGSDPAQRPLAKKIHTTLQGFNGEIGRLSGGDWDLPGTLFVALLASGIIEIIRGNFRLPPWYTAFWYAFGLFTKSMLDKLDETTAPHPAGDATNPDQ